MRVPRHSRLVLRLMALALAVATTYLPAAAQSETQATTINQRFSSQSDL